MIWYYIIVIRIDIVFFISSKVVSSVRCGRRGRRTRSFGSSPRTRTRRCCCGRPSEGFSEGFFWGRGPQQAVPGAAGEARSSDSSSNLLEASKAMNSKWIPSEIDEMLLKIDENRWKWIKKWAESWFKEVRPAGGRAQLGGGGAAAPAAASPRWAPGSGENFKVSS